MIKKTFTQILVPTDCEARHTEWADTDKTFEYWTEKVTKYGYGPYAVREVEKTFDPETFTITENEIRKVKG